MATSKALDGNARAKKKSATSMKPWRTAPPPASFKSAEYVQESDNDEPASSEKGNESESNEESLRSSPADVMVASNGKLQRPAGSSSSSENESESESESESDENGSEVNDEEEEDLVVAAKENLVVPVNKSTKSSVVTFQKPSPYKPPAGFEKEKVDATPKVAHMFKKSSLEGKEVWYFTAPASLPISSIEQVSLRDARSSKAMVTHDGNEYGFIPDSADDKTYTKIMVPHGSGGYRIAVKPIDHVLRLQQVVKLPGIHDSSSMTASLSNAAPQAKKPIRQQPPGLKMRFRPIGFGDGEPGRIGSSSSSVEEESINDSDEKMEESPVVFRRPVRLPSQSSDDSSKSSESEGSSDVEMTNVSLKRKHGGEGRKPKHKKADRISKKVGRQEISVN